MQLDFRALYVRMFFGAVIAQEWATLL